VRAEDQRFLLGLFFHPPNLTITFERNQYFVFTFRAIPMLKASFCCLCFSFFAVLFCADSMTETKTTRPPADDREQAKKMVSEGNYREALEILLKLTRDPKNGGATLVDDFRFLQSCYQNLQRNHELDAIREELVVLHAKDWQLLTAVANSYLNNDHFGFTTAGVFYRGQGRGGGAWTSALERDRTRSLQLFYQASELIDGNERERGRFWLEFANAVSMSLDGGEAWRLQELTDLGTLPDYEVNAEGQWGFGRRGMGGGWFGSSGSR